MFVYCILLLSVTMICRYGQARRKGRMLVAKLDYLQYIVVRSVTSNAVAFVKRGWQAVSKPNQIESGKDQVNVSDQSLKPEGGRMPNNAGQGGNFPLINKLTALFSARPPYISVTHEQSSMQLDGIQAWEVPIAQRQARALPTCLWSCSIRRRNEFFGNRFELHSSHTMQDWTFCYVSEWSP